MIKIDTEVVEALLDQMGFVVNEDGTFETDDGREVIGLDGEPITEVENVGGIVKGNGGDPVIIRDGFVHMLEYIREKEIYG